MKFGNQFIVSTIKLRKHIVSRVKGYFLTGGHSVTTISPWSETSHMDKLKWIFIIH